jgi:hypothetical protein
MRIRTTARSSLSVLVSLALLVFPITERRAFAQAFQPSQILSHPSSYDGKRLTVSGTVRSVLPQTTRQGRDYTSFNLCNGNDSCITVFTWGHLRLSEGQRKSVSGRFVIAKRVEPFTFTNVLDAQEGSIR